MVSSVCRQVKTSLSAIVDLMKHGEEIGLSIKKDDLDGVLSRALALDNVIISLSEWDEWIVSIDLVEKSTEAWCVYTSPGLSVEWGTGEVRWAQRSTKPLEVEWTEVGPWCKVIAGEIDQLKGRLDEKRRKDAEAEEAARQAEEQKQGRLREFYGRLFENKHDPKQGE